MPKQSKGALDDFKVDYEDIPWTAKEPFKPTNLTRSNHNSRILNWLGDVYIATTNLVKRSFKR